MSIYPAVYTESEQSFDEEEIMCKGILENGM